MLTERGEWEALLTPAAPLVLLEDKASSTTAEIRVQGIDTEVFTTVASFSTEICGWEEDEVSLCSGLCFTAKPHNPLRLSLTKPS